jgi:hypothetical protein
MKFRKFTKPQFLKNIGRTLLDKLFGKYAGDLVAAGKELPAPDANDDAYFKSLSGVAMMGDGFRTAMVSPVIRPSQIAWLIVMRTA